MKLASFVQTLRTQPPKGRDWSGTDEVEVPIAAATNLTSLRWAWVNNSTFSSHIINSVCLYPYLAELHVYGLNPEEH